MASPTYEASVWDVDEQRWAVEFKGLTKWGLRAALRELRGRGYSDVTMLVEREDAGAPYGRGSKRPQRV